MPVYLTPQQVAELDAIALQELEQNGGYTTSSRPATSNAWRNVSSTAAQAVQWAQTATTPISPPPGPYSLLGGPSPATQMAGQLSSPVPPPLASPVPYSLLGGYSPATGAAGTLQSPTAPPASTLLTGMGGTAPYSLLGGMSPATNPPIVPFTTPQPNAVPFNAPTSIPSMADFLRAGDVPLASPMETTGGAMNRAMMGVGGSRPPLPPTLMPTSSSGLDHLRAQQANAGPNGGIFGALGSGAMDVANAGWEYVGKPILGVTSGALGTEPYLDPISGQMVRPEPSWRDYLDTGRTLLSQNPLDSYQESRRAVTETMANPDYSVFGLSPEASRTLTATAGDPTLYIAGGALAGLGRRAPALRPLIPFIEGAGARGPALAIGSALGTEAATRFDVPYVSEPIEQLAGGLLGGMAGYGAASFRRGLDVPVSRAVGDTPEFPRSEFPDVRMAEASADYTAATDSILRAVREEANLRRSGTAASEIMAGRSRQAQGITSQFDEAIGAGLSPEEIALQARRGAAVGSLRQTVAAPIDLPPAQRAAVFDELNRQLQTGEIRQFDYLRGVSAVQKVLSGDGLQPNEINLVRRIFGDEMANLIKDRGPSNRQLIEQKWSALTKGNSPSPELMEAQAALLDASPTERQIATRYMSAMQERVQKANARAVAKAEADIQRANVKESLSVEAQMRQNAREKWRAIVKDEELAEKLAAQPILDPVEQKVAAEYLTSMRNRIQRRVNTEVQRYQRETPTHMDVLSKVHKAILEVEDADQRTVMEAIVRKWTRDNQQLLDIQGSSAPNIAESVLASLRGDVQDSYLGAVLSRKAHLTAALKQQGIDDDLAKKVTDGLVDFELRRKFGRSIPEHISEQIRQSKLRPYSGADAMRGAADISQEIKNFQFGIGDIAVLGQQGLAAVQLSAPNLAAGLVNRLLLALHLPGLSMVNADASLPKSIAYALDGVAQGARTGITDTEYDRSILSRVPVLGKADPALMKMANKLTDLQFGTILTNLRNINYEGNLVLAKLAGADISDARVRAVAASWANANTSYAELAQKAGRAQAERGLLLTPTMRRAQIKRFSNLAQSIGAIPRITDPVQRTKALLGATAVASWGVTMLAFGKVLYDYFGAEGSEFEMDPSKPGFGNLTLGNGIVVNVFPQEQIAKTVARSLRALAEGEQDGLAEEWGRLALGSQSPALAVLTRSLGMGYEPGRGYRFGDLNDGASLGDRVLNAAPLPPIVGEALREGIGATTPFDFAGLSAYPEGPSNELARMYKVDTGRDYWEDRGGTRETRKMVDDWISRDETRIALDEQGLEASADRGNQGAQRVVQSRELRENREAQQEEDDRALESGTLPPARWRELRGERQAASRAEQDVVYAGIDPKDEDAKDAVDRYYEAIDNATMPNGQVDWEQVDRFHASLPFRDRLYIERYTGLGGTPKEREYRDATRRIEATGYWDIADEMAASVADQWRAAGFKIPARVNTRTELDQWVRETLAAEVQAQGYEPDSPEGVRSMTIAYDRLFKDYNAELGERRKGMRLSDEQLLRDLVQWGYYDGSKESDALLFGDQ